MQGETQPDREEGFPDVKPLLYFLYPHPRVRTKRGQVGFHSDLKKRMLLITQEGTSGFEEGLVS